MATVLLEPLFAPAAATSAASHHRSRHHPSFHKPPLIQPHWHLWSTHSRSSRAPDSPHTPIHATTGGGAAGSSPPPPPHIPSPKPPLQDSWHQTDHHWDANTLHGHQLYRTIQPTQWAGVAGLPTFDIFPWQLAYHGTAEYTARTLSHAKYTGFIAARSVAESVFVTHLLQEIREKRLDLDGIAETLHTTQGTDIPSKTTQARAFHAPLINLLTQQLQSHSPAPAEGTALRANDELARAKQKLHNLGNPLTPVKGTSHTTGSTHPTHQPHQHTSHQSWLTSCNLHTQP